jgi:hypothetical protein
MTRRRVGCRCDAEPHSRSGESCRRARRSLSSAGGRGSHGRSECKHDPVFQRRYECHRAQVAIVSGNYARNLNGEKAAPQPGRYLAGVSVAEFRQLESNLTPYGFLNASQAGNQTAILITLLRGGITWKGKATLLSFTAMGTERSTTRTCWSWFEPGWPTRSTATCCMNCATPNTRISPA